MVGWYHRLNGHRFEQTLGDSEGQGSLACCSSWGRKESDRTEQLNNNKRCSPRSTSAGRSGINHREREAAASAWPELCHWPAPLADEHKIISVLELPSGASRQTSPPTPLHFLLRFLLPDS